jgi:hypothetical protein
MRWSLCICATIVSACTGGPPIDYASAPGAMQTSDAVDQGEAQALEQAETDCARQGKHAVSQRIEGETVYNCADTD